MRKKGQKKMKSESQGNKEQDIMLKKRGIFQIYPPYLDSILTKKWKIRCFRDYVATIYQKKMEMSWHEWGS